MLPLDAPFDKRIINLFVSLFRLADEYSRTHYIHNNIDSENHGCDSDSAKAFAIQQTTYPLSGSTYWDLGFQEAYKGSDPFRRKLPPLTGQARNLVAVEIDSG